MRHFRVGEHGTPGGTTAAVARDGRGRLWLATPGGLRVLGQGGGWETPPATLGAPDGNVSAMLLGRDGSFWLRTNNAVFGLAQDGERFAHIRDTKGFGRLAEDPQGSVWTSDMMDSGLHLVQGVAGADPEAWRTPDLFSDFLFDRAGNVWQPGYSGTQRILARGLRREITDTEHGLSGQHGYAVFQDREGSIWAGTENGIDRFRDYRLQALTLPRYISSARPLAVRPGGGVWVDRSFLASADAPPVQYAPNGTVADLTTALHAAPDGTLWSGGIGGFWRVRDGRREAVAPPPACGSARRAMGWPCSKTASQAAPVPLTGCRSAP